MAGEPDIDPPFLCTLFDGLLAQLVRPAANTEGGVCKRAWHVRVRVWLSQELYITCLSIKPVSRDQSARGFLFIESRCVVRGAGRGEAQRGCVGARRRTSDSGWRRPRASCGLGRGKSSGMAIQVTQAAKLNAANRDANFHANR